MSIKYKNPVQDVTPGGRIRFYKGLGLDKGYSNSIFFATKAEQADFFAAQASNEITYNNGSKTSPTMVVKSPFTRSFKIPANSAEIFPYDYIEVTPNVSGSGSMAKRLYMFITGVSFINDAVAQIDCELDVIQTFMFDWQLGTQSVEQMHSSVIYDRFSEQLKSEEKFNPSVSEVVNSTILSKAQTNGNGYIIATTEVLYKPTIEMVSYGYSGEDTTHISPVGKKDANQLLYVYCGATAGYTAEENLFYLIWQYDKENKLNAIKKIMGCPPILQGIDARSSSVKWLYAGRDIGAPKLDNFEDTFPGCHPIVSGDLKTTTTVSAPNNINLYVPMDPKTFNLLELEVGGIDGGGFTLNTDSIFTDKIDITINGVFSLDPQIIVFPSVNEVPAIASNNVGGVMSNMAPIFTLSKIPTFTIYNSDNEEIFYTQESVSAANALASTTASIASGIIGAQTAKTPESAATTAISTATGAFSTLSNTIANAQTRSIRQPYSLIGSSSPSAKWLANINYVVANWKAPSKVEVRAYDMFVSIFGYNQNGSLMDLSGSKYMPRSNFSFIKTMNANINGALGIYKGAIESAFNNGIRFWDKSFAASGTIGSFPDSVITSNTPR